MRLRWAGWALGMVVSTSTPGWAQGDAPSSDEEAMSNAAQELYDEARQARVDDDHTTCHAKASLAWQAEKHLKIAALLGDCALAVGKPVEAVRMLRHFLDHRPEDAPPKVVEHIESRLAAATAQASAITFTVTPAEAEVKVDGEAVDADQPYLVTPGEHEVTVSAAGFKPSTQTVQLLGGQRLGVEAVLIPEGETRLPDEPDPGSFEEDDEALPWWPAAVAGGLGLVGIGVGAGLIASAGSSASDADDLLGAQRTDAGHDSPCNELVRQAACSEIAALRSDEETMQNAGLGLLVGGGALVAAGVVYLFLPQISGEGDSIVMVPWASPQVGGAAVQGKF